MRGLMLLVLALPFATLGAQQQGFGVCKPVRERTAAQGCWILTDHSIGRAARQRLYWHLDTYPDSVHAVEAAGAKGIVISALGKVWVMTIDGAKVRRRGSTTHVADIGPLRVRRGVEYTALLMEAITTPGSNSAVHRHSGPEAWYTEAGETCLETPSGRTLGTLGHPVVVPQGPPMRLTTTGKHERRAITLILHDASKPPTTMETHWKPKGLCR